MSEKCVAIVTEAFGSEQSTYLYDSFDDLLADMADAWEPGEKMTIWQFDSDGIGSKLPTPARFA